MGRGFVVAGLVLAAVSVGVCGTYGGGRGTGEDPYVIASVEHLVEMGRTHADYGAHFLLVADLDMAGTVYRRAVIAPDVDDTEWGAQGEVFDGVFDGGGHTVSNFTAENSRANYLALFGNCGETAVLRNVHLADFRVKGLRQAAGLVARLEGLAENCSVVGEVRGLSAVGGLAAYLQGGTVTDSACDVTIRSNEDCRRFVAVGGLVGNNIDGVIERCSARCSIETGAHLHVGGGLTGLNDGGVILNSGCEGVRITAEDGMSVGALSGGNGGTIRNCVAFDFEVVCKGTKVGGLVGANGSLIVGSVAEGQVAGLSGTGGIAGSNSGYIIDCYSNVTSGAVRTAGGFAGENTYGILRSYSIGRAMSVEGQAGGFVGADTGLIDLSFWDVERSGNTFDAAAVGLRTSELKRRSTFKCWGDSVWFLDEHSDYPRLAWENTPGVLIRDEPVGYGGGSGTIDDPYRIYDAEHLVKIGVYPQDYEKNFRLMADIDLEGVEFRGICFGFGFGGVFDGNGHAIRNYRINNDLGFSGLFPVVLQTGVLKDLVVDGFEVSGLRAVGGLCGRNEGLIERCSARRGWVRTRETGQQTSWGGLAGHNGGRIRSCFSDVRVEATCDGVAQLGGLVGMNAGLVERSGSAGQVVCDRNGCSWIGGLAGKAWYKSKIYDCYSLADVVVSGSGCRLVGGFLGGQWYGAHIKRSYCSGNVRIAEDCKDGAAFVGYVDVQESQAAHSSVVGCFWNSDCDVPERGIARETPARIVLEPATTEQLQDAAFLEAAGWDISGVPGESVWWVEAGALPRTGMR